MPALLLVYYPIHIRNSAGIFKYPKRRLKRNSVLSPVDTALAFIPDEEHLYIQKCITPGNVQRLRPGTSEPGLAVEVNFDAGACFVLVEVVLQLLLQFRREMHFNHTRPA